MSTLIPTTPADPTALAATIANDGWYPDLSLAAFLSQTEAGDIFTPERLAAVVQSAMIEVNASIAAWRAGQSAASLDAIPATAYGGISEKVILYTSAVFSRARAQLLRTVRDYDSTRDGHDRAAQLEEVAGDYLRQSAEALARLIGRPRLGVDLI